MTQDFKNDLYEAIVNLSVMMCVVEADVHGLSRELAYELVDFYLSLDVDVSTDAISKCIHKFAFIYNSSFQKVSGLFVEIAIIVQRYQILLFREMLKYGDI